MFLFSEAEKLCSVAATTMPASAAAAGSFDDAYGAHEQGDYATALKLLRLAAMPAATALSR